MYQSSLLVNNKPLQQIKNDFIQFLANKKNIYCSVLKRQVSLAKQPKAVFGCKNQQNRIPVIFVVLDIVQKSKSITSRIANGNREYEISGLSKNGEMVKAHIREEIQKKDKILYLTTRFKKDTKIDPLEKLYKYSKEVNGLNVGL